LRPKEVIMSALDGGKPERVPVALVGAGMWSVHHYGTRFEDISRDAGKMSDMLVEMSGRLLSDIVYAGSGFPNFPVAALGGRIKFREMGAPDLEEPVAATEEDLLRLDLSGIDRDEVLATIRSAFKLTRSAIGDEYVVTMTAWGPFTLGGRLIGEEAMMKAVFRRPAFVGKVLDFALKMLHRFYEPLLDDGILDVILIGEPTASGDLISKRQFELFVLPHLKKFVDWTKAGGVRTIVHICGNTTDRLDLFPLTGASCISLDHKTDIAEAKETLYGKMCFAGNIDPVNILLRGTVHEVEDECRRVIETAGTEGGFILMPGCDMPPTVPHENIRKFIQVAREWKL
jgi:uroporphyrinogen decarboxylase